MSDTDGRIRVGVNGYGVIGKRVAGAVARQDDMTLVGVADVADDWRVRVAARRGITLFGATEDAVRSMAAAGEEVAGGLDDLLSAVDVVVDCTPKGVGAENASRYREAGVRFVVQGGEKNDVTGHSFVADANYASAVGRGHRRRGFHTGRELNPRADASVTARSRFALAGVYGACYPLMKLGLAYAPPLAVPLLGEPSTRRRMASLALGTAGVVLVALPTLGMPSGAAPRWTPAFGGLLMFLALVGTAATTALWYWLLQRDDVGRLSVALFWAPAVGLLLAVVVFGERPTIAEWAGVAVILSSLGVVAREDPPTGGSGPGGRDPAGGAGEGGREGEAILIRSSQ